MKLVRKIFFYSLPCFILAACSNAAKENGTTGKEATTTVKTKHPSVRYLEDETGMATLLAQGWENEDDVAALAGMDQVSDFEIASRSFYLSPDGSFTKNVRNAMEYGKWKFDDAAKTLTFVYEDGGTTDVYKIRALAADELQVKNMGINTVTILKFISNARVFKNTAEEPFHFSNNQWRIAPRKAESSQQVANRLKANLHFFILFYKEAIAKETAAISFYGLPSCLKWYAGGIYLRKKEELDDRWKNCFYNEAQAMDAYKLMDKVLDKKYEWPKNETNWLKKNLFVLEQMYNQVDSLLIKSEQ